MAVYGQQLVCTLFYLSLAFSLLLTCVIFLNFMSLIFEGLHTDLWPSTWPLSESIMAPYASLLSKSWKCSPAAKGSCVMSGP